MADERFTTETSELDEDVARDDNADDATVPSSSLNLSLIHI